MTDPVIEIEHLILKGPDGQPRAELFVDTKGSVQLRMSDGFGNARLALAVSEGGGVVVLGRHADGKVAAGLLVTEAGQPSLELRSCEDGCPGFIITIPPDGEPAAGFFDREGKITPVFPPA